MSSILNDVAPAPAGRKRHAAPEGKRRYRKRTIITLVVLPGIMAAAVAAALVLLRAPVAGSVNSAAVSVFWLRTSDFPQQTSVSCTDATGTAVVTGPDALQGNLYSITMENAYPGATCTFTGSLVSGANSTENLRVAGIDLAGLPAGWTVALDPADCGATVSKSHPNTNPLVDSSGTINGPTSGIKAVPASQFAAGLCN